jgi:D-alanyl-lipoteichoic acid acyltransferase DltB (MBOAT superfamily)
MLGFDLPSNFNRPYLATSLRDFWRRWHISLSTWLRDYLYIPLGGDRGSSWRTARNLALVMLLGGLWHGAAWGFVLWGAAHGVMLGVGRYFHSATGINADNEEQSLASRAARVLLTFHLVAGCFVLFRASDFATAQAYLARMLSFHVDSNVVSPLAYAVLILAIVLEVAPRNIMATLRETFDRAAAPIQGGLIAATVLLLTVLSESAAPFIYFQF